MKMYTFKQNEKKTVSATLPFRHTGRKQLHNTDQQVQSSSETNRPDTATKIDIQTAAGRAHHSHSEHTVISLCIVLATTTDKATPLQSCQFAVQGGSRNADSLRLDGT